MFKSIFRKLVVIFVFILVFSFSVTGGMLFYFLNNFVTQEKVEILDQTGEKINAFLQKYIYNQNDPVASTYLQYILESYSSSTSSVIWIIDKSGNIVRFSSIPKELKEKLNYKSEVYSLPDERQFSRIISGEKKFIKEVGNFYGLFENTGISWLTIEKPFIIKDSEGKESIIGAILLHTPIPEIKRARASIFYFFIISVLVAVSISIILIYIFSLRISKPLKKINSAAKVISKGDFRKKLDIDSEDEIGELAKSFNQMIVALENLEEMRRGFIANVSHELRTPMTSIRGFIEGILDGTIPPEKHKDYLIIVRNETARLNRLVNDLLDLAKMEAGELKLTFRIFDINELIRICVIKLQNQIIEKSLEFEADFEKENMYVYADSDSIERVVINLLHNAIKFTQEKGNIVIRTSHLKGRVLIEVQDNGMGIEKEELDLIWERFHKTDKSRGKDKTGVGLGLAIVKNIIGEHKQEIWVESEKGEGTKFSFTLNRAKEEGKEVD